MENIFSLNQLREMDQWAIGGKAAGLLNLQAAGCLIPDTLVLTCSAYEIFMEQDGLREKIALVLNRKPFEDMRWEEIWDTALRVKSLFLTTQMPESLSEEISSCLAEFACKGDIRLAIRSSSPEEDQTATSFAGLHKSYLNVPIDRALLLIKKVWASLWSDKALLYRQELALSVEASSMAVILQKMIPSDVAGVCFTHDPLGTDNMIVEAVYGLNQGLVDGAIDPDRWSLARTSGAVTQHTQPERRCEKAAAKGNTVVVDRLADDLAASPPLMPAQLQLLWSTCLELEQQWQQPLDIEWTFADDQLYLLQARPISTIPSTDRQDQRPWYLSLHRSFANLLKLRETIEQEMLPAMDREAALYSETDLKSISNDMLAGEIQQRTERNSYWTERYWRDCIPFAHGVRLFGEVYNELLLPDDPYEFVLLLQQEEMLSTTRNSQLHELAAMVRLDPQLRETLKHHSIEGVTDRAFHHALGEITEKFGFFVPQYGEKGLDRSTAVIRLILEYAKLPAEAGHLVRINREGLEKHFLERMTESDYPFDGAQLLDLARASYRIRDDDNIFLGRIEQQVMVAVEEGLNRLRQMGIKGYDNGAPGDIANMLKGESHLSHTRQVKKQVIEGRQQATPVRARQLIGQPASQGIARGRAHIIEQPEDLFTFKAGEILIIESIDPNMTFVIPLAAAIVEKRGGMLIHGAIIAREYGIPCITGAVNSLDMIHTGDLVVVDGFLGIITVAADQGRPD